MLSKMRESAERRSREKLLVMRRELSAMFVQSGSELGKWAAHATLVVYVSWGAGWITCQGGYSAASMRTGTVRLTVASCSGGCLPWELI